MISKATAKADRARPEEQSFPHRPIKEKKAFNFINILIRQKFPASLGVYFGLDIIVPALLIDIVIVETAFYRCN